MVSLNQPTTQLVIHRQLSELAFIFPYLQKNTANYLCRQHNADDEIPRTHCHFALKSLSVSKQSLSKFLNANGISGSDNFGILTVTKKDKKPYNFDMLSIYICKGLIYDDSLTHSVPKEDVLMYIESWKTQGEATRSSQEKGKTSLDIFIDVQRKAYEELTETCVTLQQVRKWLMRLHWKQTGRLPHATSYKRDACTIYLNLIERLEPNRCVATALDEIMEWNY